VPKIEEIVDEEKFKALLEEARNPPKEKVRSVVRKASLKRGLSLDEVAILLNADDKKLVEEMFKTAAKIKRGIYGNRLVFFAPLYVSNFCVNDCEYCGFHTRNKAKRKKLSLKEVGGQVRLLEDMGHKRLLLEFGEDSEENPVDYVVDVIKTIYATKSGRGEIRRVNVNIAATTTENYRKLKEAGIGTYQLFQETYHRETYKRMHNGPKADYERQLFAHDRAFEAGIDDLGLGVLFGLYDYRFEVLALVSHAQYLDRKFGVGPHTFSVPRWQPAETVGWNKPPHYVSEDELLKTIAILRLAVPYTGMIISTRERPELRAKAFEIGISQASAASRTSPGGYGKGEEATQFLVADQRKVDEVLKSIMMQGLLPSFCTACYRVGRTGDRFMEYAKSGEIQKFCLPNAILTFKEYITDYGSANMKALGEKTIAKELENIPDPKIKKATKKKLKEIEEGKRDKYF